MDTFVKEKDKVKEQQLPGRNFSSGNTTLFDIAQSKGSNLGHMQMESDAQVSDRDKEILANAIPANRIETVLRAKAKSKATKETKTIKRGMICKHKPTGKKVTIINAEVDTDEHGKIRHEVCVVGTKKKYKVLEENLEVR